MGTISIFQAQELLAHEQQIHLNKAEIGCQHALGASFSAKKRISTQCVARVDVCSARKASRLPRIDLKETRFP